MLKSCAFADVATAFADDHAQFDFPVGFARIARDFDVVVGADNGAGPFAEHHRLGGDGGAGFGSMVGVVQADADKFADLTDAGADTR